MNLPATIGYQQVQGQWNTCAPPPPIPHSTANNTIATPIYTLNAGSNLANPAINAYPHLPSVSNGYYMGHHNNTAATGLGGTTRHPTGFNSSSGGMAGGGSELPTPVPSTIQQTRTIAATVTSGELGTHSNPYQKYVNYLNTLEVERRNKIPRPHDLTQPIPTIRTPPPAEPLSYGVYNKILPPTPCGNPDCTLADGNCICDALNQIRNSSRQSRSSTRRPPEPYYDKYSRLPEKHRNRFNQSLDRMTKTQPRIRSEIIQHMDSYRNLIENNSINLAPPNIPTSRNVRANSLYGKLANPALASPTDSMDEIRGRRE